MSKIRDGYGRYLQLFDFLWATCLAIGISAVAEVTQSRAGYSGMLSGNRLSAYVGIASVSGALLGFIITSITVNLAFIQMPQMKLLQESGRGKEILDINFRAILWLAISTGWSFVGLLTDTDRKPRVILSYITMWIVAVTTVRVYRCIWVLRKFSGYVVDWLGKAQAAQSALLKQHASD